MGQLETAYFAGGCFWCITPAFRELPGVADVVSGYSGGEEADPSYLDVKYQRTGHRETIRIDYDPGEVAFEQLMDIFLGSVDPYDPDGQFIDRGFSYTLAIYHCSESQRKAAEGRIRSLEEAVSRFTSVWSLSGAFTGQRRSIRIITASIRRSSGRNSLPPAESKHKKTPCA